MMRRSATLTLAAMVALVLLAAAGSAVAADKTCCFTNVRYHGVCEVIPAEGESCASILAYLNDANSVGKGYCGGTNIRLGWTRVECKGGTSSAAVPAEPLWCAAADSEAVFSPPEATAENGG